MALTILNNISSMTAQNALSNTQSSLQKTLTQLSTGLKINSGSDDAAGLSIVSGMNANISALTQSQQNASNGIGMLQTADGALSQTTTLLNRAVTLATEGSTSGITASQSTALNTEFQSILSEINQIGQATNFNGSNVFGVSASNTLTGSAASVTSSTALSTYAAATTTNPLIATTNTAATTATTNATTATTDATAAALLADLSGGTVLTDQQALATTAATTLTTAATKLTAAGDTAGAATATAAAAALTSAKTGWTTATTGTVAAGDFTTAANALTAASSALTAAVATMPAKTGGTGTIIITDSTSGKSLTVNQGATATDAASTDNKNYTATAKTADDLNAAITAVFGGSVTGAIVGGKETITVGSSDTFKITSSETAVVGGSPVVGTATSASNNVNSVYIGDGTTTGSANTTINTSISSLSAGTLKLASTDLSNSTDAAAALTAITAAITSVSAQRGVIGASVNRLTAANGDMASQVTNLQSAANSIQNADIGKTVANMTQYNVLQSTGMAALQQSNQAQQAVLKLVQ
jgi:flagellin